MIVCDIKINRRYGKWNLKDATDEDNLAYWIYLEKTNDTKKKRKRFYIRESQYAFKKHYKSGPSYEKARLYIRSYKINKLKERICSKYVKKLFV